MPVRTESTGETVDGFLNLISTSNSAVCNSFVKGFLRKGEVSGDCKGCLKSDIGSSSLPIPQTEICQ